MTPWVQIGCLQPRLGLRLRLTAGNIQGAGLLVQGEESQVHGAGTGDGDPEVDGVRGLGVDGEHPCSLIL